MRLQGVKESLVSQSFAYFDLPDSCEFSVRKAININTCSKRDLNKLGIRKSLVNRIINFRKALGGYHTLVQLKDVYGIKETEYKKLEGCLSLNEINLRKIFINRVSYFELRKHPYISNKIASRIVNYRTKIGRFKSKSNLTKVHDLSEITLEKIAPYLSFE